MTVKNGAKKVVSATLAGLMAVGTMPVAAFAESGNVADTTDDSAVELQSVSAAQNFSRGTVSAATIDGNAVSSVVADKKEHAYAPTEITELDGTKISLVPVAGQKNTYANKDDATDTYTVTAGYTATNPGKVTVTIHSNTLGSDLQVKDAWTIAENKLDGAVAYEKHDGSDDTSDTTFTFNNNAQNIGFALNGTALEEGKDYSVTYYNAGADGTKVGDSVAPTHAGNYVALLKGEGAYANSEAQVKFTVNTLDLSKANITLADRDAKQNAPVAKDILIDEDGLTVDDLGSAVTLKSSSLYRDKGQYTYTISAASGQNDVTGSKDLTFNKVTTLLDNKDVKYDGGELPASVHTNLDAKKPVYFDASKITVEGTDGKDLPSDQYTVKIVKVNADGTKSDASADDLKTAGKYEVSVEVNAAATDYVYGGGTTTPVEVTVDHNDAKPDVLVKVNGKLIGNDTPEVDRTVSYTGKALTPEVSVKLDGKDLTAGTDYTVSYKKDGKDVSEIKDAGEYTITVTGKNGYTIDDTTNLTVAPAKVSVSEAAGQEVYTDANKNGKQDKGEAGFIPYQDGADINVKYSFKDADGNEFDVPASAYKAVITKDGKVVDSVKDEGAYEVTFTDADANDNFEVATSPVDFTVDSSRTFKDVPANAWYAQAVKDANDQDLMHGYAGTDFFGPEDSLTRGQTAQVMFNISGGSDFWTTEENYKSANGSYVTPFADVDGSLWYGQPIAWANAMNVMSGYKGSDNFGPNDTITREQFAQTLVNYAKQVKKYNAADASVLDSYADKDSVDGWATDAVAWAVQNGIMGVNSNLDATGNITRAQAAAMLVRFEAVIALK